MSLLPRNLPNKPLKIHIGTKYPHRQQCTSGKSTFHSQNTMMLSWRLDLEPKTSANFPEIETLRRLSKLNYLPRYSHLDKYRCICAVIRDVQQLQSLVKETFGPVVFSLVFHFSLGFVVFRCVIHPKCFSIFV